jgi:hypothetical protein
MTSRVKHEERNIAMAEIVITLSSVWRIVIRSSDVRVVSRRAVHESGSCVVAKTNKVVGELQCQEDFQCVSFLEQGQREQDVPRDHHRHGR